MTRVPFLICHCFKFARNIFNQSHMLYALCISRTVDNISLHVWSAATMKNKLAAGTSLVDARTFTELKLEKI